MHEMLIKCEMGLHPFPEDMVIKSCIMHVHHKNIHNENRSIVLYGRGIIMQTRRQFNQRGGNGNKEVAGAAEAVHQFRLAGMNCGQITFMIRLSREQMTA